MGKLAISSLWPLAVVMLLLGCEQPGYGAEHSGAAVMHLHAPETTRVCRHVGSVYRPVVCS
jgi:hypothetical protein